MANTVDIDVVESLRFVAQSAKPVDAGRRAIADAADRYAELTPESAETAAILRGLLERMGGQCQVLPQKNLPQS